MKTLRNHKSRETRTIHGFRKISLLVLYKTLRTFNSVKFYDQIEIKSNYYLEWAA